MSHLQEIFDRQHTSFRRCAPLPLRKRLEALDLLLQSVINYQDILIEALQQDFGQRSARETRILEIFPLLDEIRHIKRHLRRWMRPRRAPANWQFLPSRTQTIYQPLGVVGIIGAWNYPLLLTLSPLANAIAAGNHVLIKPSEHAPATAEIIRQLVSEAFPEDYIAVIIGDSELAAAFSALPFDHILFTGSQNVGKLVMKAAAENLTPVTLELGGKSPALVHESFPLATAADRICSAKFWNAGQTCIAPDYALVPATKADAFARECQAALAKRYPQPHSNADYTHLISHCAHARMQALVDDAQQHGAQIIQPDSPPASAATTRFFPPTLILGADSSMRVMHEEIFGPILPIVTYATLDDALSFINARPRPLALYYFDRNKSRIRHTLDHTISGGVTINDCIFHFVQHDLPFGGVGPSGIGAYHGFEGFKTFSKHKGVLLQSSLVAKFLARTLKPPYTRLSDRTIRFLLGKTTRRPIHKMTLP
ncbi:MAG TPA: coniferyl aldehyde dehydrogenase [Acidobacteriaceae bacterium]|nr:coniferyl aldehyde dehydrogenase [Acidobacteriaceae bacterium]